jgi:hypothetical protein
MNNVYWCYICNNETNITQNMETSILTCNRCNQDFIEQRERPQLMHIDPANIMLIIQQIIDNGQLDQVMNESMNADDIAKIPTDTKFLNQIIEQMLSNSQLKKDCSICFNNFQKELKGCVLPCGHIYHESCIKEWLKIDHVCPTCRHELPKQEEAEADSD